MPHPTPRLDSADMWCFMHLITSNLDLPKPVTATADKALRGGTITTTYSLIVEGATEVEQWAEVMNTDVDYTSEPDGWIHTADGHIDCHHSDRGGYTHPLRVSVTARLRAFATDGAA